MFTHDLNPVARLNARFGLRNGPPVARGAHWLAALGPVRTLVDEAILRNVREMAPPDRLQALLAPLQMEMESFLGHGGKRVRAIALLSAYQAWAGQRGEEGVAHADALALDAAAAIEILHGFMLAHDDIVDRSSQRRGAPTLHVRLAALCAGDREAPLGTDLALIAGDILFGHANRVMMTADWPVHARAGIATDWCQMILETGYGQWADTLNDAAALHRLTARQVLDVARAKTALYTLAGPMRIGARLAGAPESAITALTRYGVALGTAFQIRDDLLDLCDGKSLGKDFADDLRRGRISVPLAVALERAVGSDKERLLALCSGDEGVSVAARRAWVLQLVHRTDALEATRMLLDEEVDEALDAIEDLRVPEAELWRGLAASIRKEAQGTMDVPAPMPAAAHAVLA